MRSRSMPAAMYQVIVASVLQREGRYLCVEEPVNGEIKLNQPAGKLEIGEPPAHGAVRETYEETGHSFLPTHIVGIYEYYDIRISTIFLRIAYTGALFSPQGRVSKGSDRQIAAVRWLTYEELQASRERHRSPYVLRCVADLRAGNAFPLNLISHFPAFPAL